MSFSERVTVAFAQRCLFLDYECVFFVSVSSLPLLSTFSLLVTTMGSVDRMHRRLLFSPNDGSRSGGSVMAPFARALVLQYHWRELPQVQINT